MADAAQILIDADSVLTNGKYHNYVYGRLHQWGFVGNGAVNACITTNIQKMPSDLNVDFTQDGVSFRIFNPDQQIIHLNILNINGQLVSQRDMKQLQYSYQNENLAAGIYLVSLQTESAMKTFKWCIAK